MNPVRKVVVDVQTRQQIQLSWDCASLGLICGGLLGIGLAVSNLFAWTSVPSVLIVASVFLGPLLGFTFAWLRSPNLAAAASTIDRKCDLKDRTATALGFLELGDRCTPLQRLQVTDAELHIKGVNPVKVVPMKVPRSMFLGMLCTTAALALGLISFSGQTDAMAGQPNAILVTQASKVDRELEQLRQLQSDQASPEIEKLLQELNEKLEELKEPNVDPKEALAKLSEMEASIQKMQKELNEEQNESTLKEIGEALTLSDSMASAGKAMSKGEMEKAADELKKMEMPEMDRQTEKSVKEKLDAVCQKSGNAKQGKLKEAAQKLCSSLGNKDASKFKEASDGLASECKKQGNRKKLSDLLRKQCQCLSECKSECENECNSKSSSKIKGGKNAGKSASGNDAGESTAKLASNNKMNIT